jgi:hypothetical protein
LLPTMARSTALTPFTRATYSGDFNFGCLMAGIADVNPDRTRRRGCLGVPIVG